MAGFLKNLLPCFPWNTTSASSVDEKSSLLTSNQPEVYPDEVRVHVDETASYIIEILITKTNDSCLQGTINDIINGTNSPNVRNTINILGWVEWKERVAETVLLIFTDIVKTGAIMDRMRKVYEFAKQKVEKFVDEHPIWTDVIITLIAMAMLEILLPWVLEALGFAVIGIRLGSWAAKWQSVIGDVEKRSLFAFLQRLGMTFRGLR